MIDNDDDDVDDDERHLKLISTCGAVVIAQSNLLVAAIARKRKLLAAVDSNLKVKVGRKLYDRYFSNGIMLLTNSFNFSPNLSFLDFFPGLSIPTLHGG